MRIRTKIIYGFFTLGVILSFAGLISVIELKNMGKEVSVALHENYISIGACTSMMFSLNKSQHGIMLSLSGQKQEGFVEIHAADSIFLGNLKVAEDNISLPGEDSLIRSITVLYQGYRESIQLSRLPQEESSKFTWLFTVTGTPYFNLTSQIEELRALNSMHVHGTTSSLNNKARRAIMPGIVAIIAGLVFVLIFNYFINYYFISPVVKISKGIRDFRDFHIPFRVNIETKDELLELKDSVESILGKSRQK